MPPEPFIPLNRTARLFALPQSWLKVEARAGRLPHLEVRGRLRFRLSEVEAALRMRTTGRGTAEVNLAQEAVT